MKIIQNPKLVEGVLFRVSRVDDSDDVIIFAGADPFLLRKAHYEMLVPLLDGTHSLQQIAAKLKGKIDVAGTVALVQKMASHGAVVDLALPEKKGAGTAAVRQVGEVSAETMRSALERAGVRLADDNEEPDLLVVVTDHYLRDALADLNRKATSPLLLVRPDGREIWVGPLIVPHQTSCWDCLAHRLRFNRRAEHFATQEEGILPVPRTALTTPSAGDEQIAFAVAAEYARNWLERGTCVVVQTLITLDPRQMVSGHHHVIRRPQCPTCGNVGQQRPFPELRPRPRTAPTLAERDAAADQLLKRYAHHISPITGLVPKLTRQSLSRGIHVYAGGPYLSRLPADRLGLAQSMRFRAAGKGLTEATAKASALAETLEWYTLSAQDAASVLRERYTRLKACGRAIPPPALTNYSEGQFADREAINSTRKLAKYRIPMPFDIDAVIEWTAVRSLTRREPVFVPAAAAMNVPSAFMNASSTGGAAGATLEDAIVHGAMEAIERDAVALWWYNLARRPQVAVEGVDAILIEAMREHYSRIGHRFWLLDITTDLKIPAMVAISIGEDQTSGRPFMGFGADFDPCVAATRALIELNQLHPLVAELVVRQGRENVSINHDEPLPPQIFPRDDVAPISLGDLAAAPDEGRDSIATLVDSFDRRGLELLAADLTLPDVGMPVAKVIVPGLRSCYPELGPGRLHDVPLALGWIERPVEEAAMRRQWSPC